MKFPSFIFIILISAVVGCGDKRSAGYKNIPIETYIIGSWVQDSTNRKIGEREHAGVVIESFLSDTSGVSYFYHIKHNRVYTFPFQNYRLTDSTLAYSLPNNFEFPQNWGQYNLVRTGANSFKLIAQFAVTNFSVPPQDSIIYYSRIDDVADYLKPRFEKGNVQELSCPKPDLSLLQGYWKEDSTEMIRYTSVENNYFYYIDTSGIFYTFWLGNNPSRNSQDFRLASNNLIFSEGQMPIKCLDEDKLIFEWKDNNYYSAKYLSRINPNGIIPDSMRIDK